MIYNVKDNTLNAYGVIWDGDGAEFIRNLSRLEAAYSDVVIHLHTYGGSVFDGNLICNAIEGSTANITIIVDGLAASMGAIILLSAKNVKIVNNGYVMIHSPHGSSYGNAKDHDSYAHLLSMMEDNFVEKLIARTGRVEAEVRDWLTTDTWINAKGALDLGIVTEVIPAKITPIYEDFEPEEIGETETYNMYACALLTNETTQFKNDMKQLLIMALGLATLTAESSDTAVLDAVKKKFTDLNDLLDKENKAKIKAENDLKAYRQTQIKAMIENASKSAPSAFSEEDQALYENIGENSGIEALTKVLAGTSSKPQSITGTINHGKQTTDAKADWSFEQWQTNDPKGLEEMSTKNPDQFKKLFNEKYKK